MYRLCLVAVAVLLVGGGAALYAYKANGTYSTTGKLVVKEGDDKVVNAPYTADFTLNGTTLKGNLSIYNGKVNGTIDEAPTKTGESTRTIVGGSFTAKYHNSNYGFNLTKGTLTWKKANNGNVVFSGNIKGKGIGKAAGLTFNLTAKGVKQ